MQPRTVQELPPDYQEALFFRVTIRSRIVFLNVAAIALAFVALVIFVGWLTIYHVLDAPLVIESLPNEIPTFLGIVIVIGSLPLHEWVHGLGMQYYGHPVRYGIKPLKGVLYATSPKAFFWRSQFIMIALAPLVVISLLMTTLSLFFPAGIALWFMFAAAINATGAIADMWMTRIVLQYPATALIRDEKDGMRIFVPAVTN